jgi:hypothetical protein
MRHLELLGGDFVDFNEEPSGDSPHILHGSSADRFIRAEEEEENDGDSKPRRERFAYI